MSHIKLGIQTNSWRIRRSRPAWSPSAFLIGSCGFRYNVVLNSHDMEARPSPMPPQDNELRPDGLRSPNTKHRLDEIHAYEEFRLKEFERDRDGT